GGRALHAGAFRALSKVRVRFRAPDALLSRRLARHGADALAREPLLGIRALRRLASDILRFTLARQSARRARDHPCIRRRVAAEPRADADRAPFLPQGAARVAVSLAVQTRGVLLLPHAPDGALPPGQARLMEKLKAIASWPTGGILDRYIILGFLKIVALSLLCTTALYLIVDFFDPIDGILKAGAPVWSAIRYFLYKLPVLLSRVFGFAVLFSTLFSIGMLSRTQEITAMRAAGISVHRIALPLFVTGIVIC